MLYHYTLGFPKDVNTNFGIVKLEYSFHAMRAAQNDRYGLIKLPTKLDTSLAIPIEVEVDFDGTITKVVYRSEYCNDYDIMVVLIPGRNFVKTVWLNCVDDDHGSLDTSRYCNMSAQPQRSKYGS